MGMIYKNGVPYFGGGGGGTGNVDSVNGISPDVNKNVQVDVELTQAEYDALPSSKLTDDVNYWITDGSNNPLNNNVMATGVVYDNTDSGLTATNAQDAIDENAGEIADVKSGLNSLIIRRYRATAGTETITLKRGHSYIAVITRLNSVNADYSGLYVIQCHASSSVAAIQQSTIATLSISDTTLTFTSTATYAGLWILDLGAIA